MHLRGSALSIIPPSPSSRIQSEKIPLGFLVFRRMSSNCDPTSSHAATNAPSKFTFRDSTGRATNRKSNPFRRAPARGNCRVAHLRRCDFTRFYFFFFFFSLSLFLYIYFLSFVSLCFFFKFISLLFIVVRSNLSNPTARKIVAVVDL